QGQYCDICSSANSNKAHPITNAIDGTERWWQSPPLSRGLEFNQVNVTLDLGQLFHVAYVLIKFANSPRPDLWVLERSTDFGLTYEPWQYFASSKRDCIEKFGQHTVDRITRDDHAICTTEYSRIVPLENGEIVVSLVNGRPGAMNFSYSPLLRNFTKATNIRLRFLQTNTLLGHLMGKALRDPTVTRRVRQPLRPPAAEVELCKLQCDCQHNTCGGSCDRCCPGYNQFPWKPATADSANECQPCNCNGHAYDCYYDPEVDRHKASRSREDKFEGGGVCIDCQHHTTGINCERCIPGYYRSPDHPIDSPYVCYRCNCESDFTDGTCEDLTGRCYCKPNYTGEHCDTCAEGYLNFPHCYRKWGSLLAAHRPSSCGKGQQLQLCDTGQCLCRTGFEGHSCDRCAPGYFNYPLCQSCQCSREGSLHGTCDQDTGQCSCRPKVTGLRCDSCVPGAYGFPHCQVGSCNPAGLETADPSLGSCACRAYVEGPACDRCKPGYWNLTPENPYGCLSCKCDTRGTINGITECRQGDGQCFCKANVCGQFCSACRDGYFNMENANYFGCQGCRCDVGGALGASCEERSGACRCRQSTRGPTCTQPARDHYFPDLHHLKFELEEGTTPAGRTVRFGYNPLEFEGFSWRGYAQMSSIQVRLQHSPLYLFHVILRYINSGGATVYGKITAYQPRRRGTEQTKQIVFAPSTEPAFVTVPQNSFGEPFVLNPNTWSLVVEAEGVLLDYLVLLPSSYYEAPILQLKVTEPCVYQPVCKDLMRFVALSPELQRRLVCSTGMLHTVPQSLSVLQVEVQLSLPVAQPGKYVLLVEYANTNALQTVGIAVSSPHSATQQGSFTFYPCVYRYLRGQRGHFSAMTRTASPPAKLFWVYHTSKASFSVVHLSSVCAIRAQICAIIKKPSQLWVQVSAMDLCLCSPVLGQAAVVFNSRIQTLGRYAFILHFYQPSHPTFPVEVLINGGRIWQGQTNANFCPHAYGCRSLVVSEDQIILDVTDNDLTVVVRVPEGKQLWLDYILVVPEDSYTSQYLQEEPLDKSYDFISSCGINSFYINPSTSSRFCRDSAISLSLFYNNGAQPCRCHEAGARGSQCQPFGGQCPCRSNVIGRECSRCATGYWGFPNCRPCDCGTRLCDEVTGQCICPPHTLKPECVVCEPQTFGCHPLIGCEDCNCSRPGVQELTEPGCDVDSGQCRCKPNIIGRQCDLCAPGYYHYPECRRCDCHQAGTEASVCDPVTGQCHCKENVEGLRCDQCRLGTFSLDATNPKGCTKCFCFGATDRCRSAEKHRAEFVDMNGWLLLSSDRHEVPTALSPREQLITADLKNLPDAFQELYWVAPSSYLGDQVSSYGGHLRYELHSNPRRGDVFIPMESRPDVILKGNQMSIMFLEGAYPSPGEAHEGRLQLVEGNFRHTETHNPVSREELMMVLANLEQLQIRALFSQLSSSVSLRRVVLETATDTATGVRASNVELCFCPANYQGDSCQECAPGYYRDTKGLFLGKCIPCHCNGHSDQCLPGSGICLNCQHNTEGDHCERCKDGYMVIKLSWHPVRSNFSSLCPHSHFSFAVGCVHKGSNMQCLCKPGYAGPNCERCAPGYYGNPLVIGSSCQPCDCSGNTDPNMLFSSCDPLTGACSGCMHHTAGARCQLCAPGYYGDHRKRMLQRVRSELHARWQSNQELLSSIQERLAQHSSQLMDLRDALNEAVNKTRQTEDLNSLNRNNLEETQVDLHHGKQHALVQETLQMAQDALAQVSDFLQMMERAKEAYEKLAALLDGAKLPLTERVKKFSPASSKIPIVEQAEEHAQLLDELARNLSGDTSFFAEDTKDTIQNAKAAAAEANETAARVEDTLSTMKKSLDEWKDQYGGLRNEDLNQAVQDARKSGEYRWQWAQCHRAGFLSLQVKVPMKFNGSSGVQVRMPSNLQDLAAYTSLKFYIQNPEPRSQQDEAQEGRFVLYLGSQEATGDYMGIVLKDQRVHWIYKLGDEEPTSLSVDEDIGEQFVTISINRWGLCSGRAGFAPLGVYSVAKGEQGLLNLDPRNVVFYVGGYPSSFTPPPALRYPNYRGCLELDTLNEEVVSLYNFQHTFELDTSTGDPWLTDGSYFDGTGYAEIKFESQFGTTKRFEQEIRVVSYNGIIFFLENQAGACSPGEPSSLRGQSQACLQAFPVQDTWEGRSQGCLEQDFSSIVKCYERTGPKPHKTSPRALPVHTWPGVMAWKRVSLAVGGEPGAPIAACPCRSHFSLEVKLNSSSGLLFYVEGQQGSSMALFVSNGRFVFLLDVGRRQLRIRSKDKYRDRRWHTVSGHTAQQGLPEPHLPGLFVAQTPLYVGGLPSGKAKAASASSFDGCLRNPQLDGRPLGPPSRTFGVTPCFEGALESGVFFATDGGSIDLEVTLEVRPRSASGLIFHIGTRRSHHLLLYMEETKVLGEASAGADEFSASVTSPALCDGQWHTIAGEVTAALFCASAPALLSPHLLGELRTNKASTGLLFPPVPHYVGCVRNLLINQRHVDLPRAGTARGSVGLQGCPLLSVPHPRTA
uniref:Laminin subunit alpha 5 n=1 Tax=Ficedula albicollis TaxID=59894 RepID=U3K7L1_FICAL